MKQFRPTREMINSAKKVFMMMAIVETIKPIVTGYQLESLTKHQFKNIHSGEVITKPFQSYLMSDEDYQIYWNECRASRNEAGLQVESDEFCPLLVAEYDVVKAKRELAEVMEPITKIKYDQLAMSLENIEKYFDLTLKL